jgi:ABC-2 type transport system permease protein
MSTPTAHQIRMDVAPIPRMAWMETRAKLLNRIRVPAFTFFSLAMPVGFFALFNAIYGSQRQTGGVTAGKYLLASMATYACANVMVYNFGIGIANDRGQKMDLLQRAMPLPGAVAMAANLLSAVAFAAGALLVLFAYALTIGGVRIDAATTGDLLVRLLLGALPMAGLGIAIGYGTGPNVAPALTNAIYLPMTFLSGIFIPLAILPAAIRSIGSLLPTYHYAQLAWGALGASDESLGVAVLWLVGWGIVLFFLALRVYRLDQSRKFS